MGKSVISHSFQDGVIFCGEIICLAVAHLQ